MLARPNDYCNFHGGGRLSLQARITLAGSTPATADSLLTGICKTRHFIMSCGVMVAQMFLVHLVEVQILAGQPFYLTQNFTNA